MVTFSDLVLAAQPALFSGGVAATVTAGRTWLFEFEATDSTNTAVDLTGVTGTCNVYSEDGVTVLTTLAVTGALGSLTVRQEDENTQGLSSGIRGRSLSWDCVITDGQDSAQVWAAHNSRLVINPA